MEVVFTGSYVSQPIVSVDRAKSSCRPGVASDFKHSSLILIVIEVSRYSRSMAAILTDSGDVNDLLV